MDLNQDIRENGGSREMTGNEIKRQAPMRTHCCSMCVLASLPGCHAGARSGNSKQSSKPRTRQVHTHPQLHSHMELHRCPRASGTALRMMGAAQAAAGLVAAKAAASLSRTGRTSKNPASCHLRALSPDLWAGRLCSNTPHFCNRTAHLHFDPVPRTGFFLPRTEL